MIKRLIFDVDNTLITNVSFIKAIEKTFRDLNIYSEEKVNGFLEGIKTYENIYNNYNAIDYIKHMEQKINCLLPLNFLEVFFDNLKNVIPERNENLIKTVRDLHSKYELVLLTNYFSISQLNRLNNMGIGQYFIECHGEKNKKPNSDSYLNAFGKNNPDECIMIGDDLYLDIECAQKARLHTIFVNTKNISIDNNLKTIVVSKVEEINSELIEKIK
jgi:FMN phosphatase YigB (HAD superfamily)